MLEVSERLVEQYTAYIYDRGGRHRIGVLDNLNAVMCTRVRDDRSQGNVALTALQAARQSDLLNMIEPMRHELVIYRGKDRIWEGPITRITFSKAQVDIHAEDVLYYVYRTVMRVGYSSAYPNVEAATARALRILNAELTRWEALSPPINVKPHLVRHAFPNEANTSQVTKPYEMNLFDHIDNMARGSGIDYTVVGRAIHLWDTSRSIGETPTTTENDYLGELYITYYGAELATHSYVTDGQGGVGSAVVTGPESDYYGPVEVVQGAYGNDDDEGIAVPIAVLNSQAQRNLTGRFPVPLQVRVPDNASINMAGVLTPDMLVPGTYIPLMATLSVRTVSQMQKLHSVTFKEGPEGEQVNVVLTPASRPDSDEED